MKDYFIIVALVVLILMSGFSVDSAFAENRVILFSTEEWKDATNRDGTGLYWDILRAIFEPDGFQVKPVIRSYEGSVQHVKSQSVDAMVGSYADEIENVIYPENHFAIDIVQVVFKKNAGFQWAGLKTMRAKNVGWITGYAYHEYLPENTSKHIKIRRLDNREAGFRLLEKDIIDFYIDAKGDISHFLQDSAYYNPDDYFRKTILELNLYVVFANTERGKKLAGLFDRHLKKLIKNTELKKMYDKYKDSFFTYPSDLLKH
ncbi:MAG: transporter substrate-binding domain-containing protein [Desulfobacula sp.]|nr:transporter substrate-binding domain-containing protein [Desulfobacula sp.]